MCLLAYRNILKRHLKIRILQRNDDELLIINIILKISIYKIIK